MTGPELAGPGSWPGEIVPLRLPRPAELFGRRAQRFQELSAGHAAGDFLEAMAALCRAQAVALGRSAAPPGRELPARLPLAAVEWPRPGWRDGLAAIAGEMARVPLPGPARAALERLGHLPEAELEALADALLGGATGRLDMATVPFVGAALQVHFAAMAAGLDAGRIERSERGCPVCGSPPVAGLVLGDDKLRYLTCSLCGSDWHFTRVVCSGCRQGGKLRYLAIEGDPGGAKAEACGDCGTYLKVFYAERMPRAEPFADDAASIALDLLVAEEGYARGGVNLFLLAGAEI
ncbi:MAG TPA: formate dehydrogenase accessory protein FdhE [Anaeromyxobacteraceae bacterium]|nr:formate dehydrogenase accessory protein FdhE [Anaeromyxobacteraceae bacterium]